MPCYDYRDERNVGSDLIPLQQQIKKMYQHILNIEGYLCETIKFAEKNVGSVVKFEVFMQEHPSIDEWWTNHQFEDQKRKDKLREIALAKLTPEEIELLGIKLPKTASLVKGKPTHGS